jgi:hypothetical protein
VSFLRWNALDYLVDYITLNFNRVIVLADDCQICEQAVLIGAAEPLEGGRPIYPVPQVPRLKITRFQNGLDLTGRYSSSVTAWSVGQIRMSKRAAWSTHKNGRMPSFVFRCQKSGDFHLERGLPR